MLPTMENPLAWFESYVHGFLGFGPRHDANIELKREHSRRVLQEAEGIAASLELPERLSRVVGLAALFHDIGRFPQYLRYRSFDDRRTVNHGLLGFRTLRVQKVLEGLAPKDRATVLQAVYWHNRPHIPEGLPGDLDLTVRILRDADKLDIYRVIQGHLTTDGSTDETVTLGLEDEPDKYTPVIVHRILAGRRVHYEQMRWLNDFALLLCSWVFDLNFAATRKALWERGHIPALCSILPANPELKRMEDMLLDLIRPDTGRHSSEWAV